MDDVINVLSARAETIVLLDDVRAQYGDAPEAWMAPFQERVRIEKEKFSGKDSKK
jgi:type IV secretion system protein VirB4